jgi:hypothetical protein
MNDETDWVVLAPLGVVLVSSENARGKGVSTQLVEVEEERYLRGYEHAFVDDRSRTHGAHIENLPVKCRFVAGTLLDSATAHVEASLKILAPFSVLRTTDKGLHDGRHAGTSRFA